MAETFQLLKGYQTKIIQINNELQLVKGEKNSLAIEHERVKQLLAESNHQLQQKILQLAQKQRLNKKLKVQKDQLDQLSQKSQRHRKILYDELYAQGQPQTYTCQSQRKVALLNNLSKIKNTFYSINFSQTQQVINQRNQEVARISNLYNNLLKQHLKSQSEYYKKLQVLKQQNFILKRKQNIRIDIQKQLQKSQKVNYQELQIRNKTLEQRVNLLIQKLKIDEETTRALNKKLADKQIQAISINRQNIQNMPQRTPQVQQYLQMIQTNRILQKQLQQSNNRYQKLVMQFPNIISNQDQIISILQKHKQLHKLQSDIELKQIKIKALVAEIQKYKQDNIKYLKEFNQKRSQYENVTERYQSIIEKFKQFFIMVNPHYSTYQFDQLNLTEDQSKVVKKGKVNNQDANLKKQLTILQDKFSKLQKALQIKNTEIENVKVVLNKQNKKINELQAINTKLNQGLQLKQIGSLQNNDQKCLKKALEVIAKLQDQRNRLTIQFRQQQIEIIQLKVQNSYYKDKKQLITYPQAQPTIQLDVNACRPHIIQIQIGKSFPEIQQKIVELQKQIKKNSNQYQFLITQIKAGYQTQIATLKQKILKLEKIKAQQVVNNQPIIQVINRQQSMHQQGQVNEVGSMLDLEQHVPFENGDEPLNTLNAQSIQQMNRLLNGHEVNLKNLIQAYSRLKQNYKRLKEHKQKNQYQQKIDALKKQLQNYVSQISLLKTRLVEADKNLVSLEQQLNLKTNEIQSLKETLKRETQCLKKQISELQKQNQSLKQENWLQSPQITTISNKKAYFPQQIEYLIQLVLQKQEKVKKLQNQKQSAKKHKLQKVALQLAQNKNSKEYEQQERQILEELIRSGSLLTVLEEANRKLKQNGKSDQI